MAEISDEEYLESTELPFFLRSLLSQLSNSSMAMKTTDEAIDFAESFFRSVLSCHHVIGSDYSYICGSKYNRRAFVYCLQESFSSISDDEEITSADYQQLVDVICPDMPRHIIYEAAYAVEPANQSTSQTTKYLHKNLRIAVFFHIVYEEWLKMTENFFREEGVSGSANIAKLKLFLDHARVSISPHIDHPPKLAIDSIGQGASTATEMTFDGLRRLLFKNPLVAAELYRKPASAVPLNRSPTQASDSAKDAMGDASAAPSSTSPVDEAGGNDD